MKIGNIISIIGISLIFTIGITIFSGKFIIGIISGIAFFSITYKIAEKTIKHNTKVETKNIMESIKEYEKENNTK